MKKAVNKEISVVAKKLIGVITEIVKKYWRASLRNKKKCKIL